jgi:SAM-dependent methyltransferase
MKSPGQQNTASWAAGKFLNAYSNRQLRPVEVVLLVRHHGALTGRVLELGCGAGRIAGYLTQLAEQCYGIDISPAMIAESRRRYRAGEFFEGELSDLSRFDGGSLDAVWAGCNVLDIFDDQQRRATLAEIHRVLRPDGLLLMSSHNRDYLPNVPGPARIRTSDPLRAALDAARAPRNLVRHTRLKRFERREPDYEIVSDGAHGYSFVHYFITPEAQFRQLRELGFEPLECLDLDGRTVPEGETAPTTVELHYVARCAASP